MICQRLSSVVVKYWVWFNWWDKHPSPAVVLTRWLDALGHSLSDRDDTFSSPHRRGKQKFMEQGIGREPWDVSWLTHCLQQEQLSPKQSWELSQRWAGGELEMLAGGEAPWRSWSWWVSDGARGELRIPSRFQFMICGGFPIVLACLFAFLVFLCLPFGCYGPFGTGFLKKQGAGRRRAWTCDTRCWGSAWQAAQPRAATRSPLVGWGRELEGWKWENAWEKIKTV